MKFSTGLRAGSLVKPISVFAALILFSMTAFGQGSAKAKAGADANDVQFVRSSAAYSEIILRRTELESEKESLLVEYTEEYPKLKEIKTEIAALDLETKRLLTLPKADAGKLSLGLGRLIVRKAELARDLTTLLEQYKEGHPDVKRTRRKIEIYEKAIKEILG